MSLNRVYYNRLKFAFGGSPPDITANSVKSFYNSYLNSPNYKARLLGQGYKNPDNVIFDRLNNLNNVNITNKLNKGSEYNSNTNTVNIDKTQLPKFNITLRDLYSHELSHPAGADVYTKNPNLGMNYNDNSLINKANKLSNYSGSDINKQHDAHSRELKADMDNLRYNLFNDKIYDTGTQTFDKDFLDKAKKKYSNDGNFKRLTDRLSDSDLINLMNKVAVNNNQDNDLPIAALGGDINNMTGYNQIRNRSLQRTKMKKYDFGGFVSDKANSNGIEAGLGFASGVFDSFNNQSNPSLALSGLSGAAKGAAAGTAVMPGLGTIIGAGLGGITSIFGGLGAKKKYQQQQEQRTRTINDANTAMSNQVLRQYPTEGIEGTQLYAMGGTIDGDPRNPYRKIMRPQDYSTYDPTLLTNGQFLVQKADGSIGQWGNDLSTTPQVIPNLSLKAPVYVSNKSRGLDNTYNTARDQQQGKEIPTIKSPTGRNRYAEGGDLSIEPSHKGRFNAYLKRTGKTAHEAANSSDPHVRKMANYAINIGHTKKADGGSADGSYEAEQGEVVQGQPSLEDSTQLSNDMHLVGGDSHENGGTIGVGGDRIFSDRLKASQELKDLLKGQGITFGSSATYADISKRIGNMKGKMEEKAESQFSPSINTAKKMLPRLENALDASFADQEMGKQIRDYKKFAKGGYLPKYADGTDLIARRAGIDPTIYSGDVPVNANINGSALNSAGFPAAQPSTWDKIGSFLGNNSGNIVNAGSYLANLGSINSLDTSVDRRYVPTPQYSYNDRSGLALNRNAALLRTGVKSLTNAGTSVNASNIGALYAGALEGNSDISNKENLRRDAYNNDFNQRSDRINTINTGIYNDAQDTQRGINNEKVGLKLGARNTLMQGIQGNAAIKAQQDLDNKKLLITLAGQDQNGVMTRLNLDRYNTLLNKFKNRVN